jgi:hypothetical protein
LGKKGDLAEGEGHGDRGGVLKGDKEKEKVNKKEKDGIEATSAKNNEVADKG